MKTLALHNRSLRSSRREQRPGGELRTILEQGYRGSPLAEADLAFLLRLRERADKEALFRAARELRQERFGRKIFLYGFLYISTFCRNNCNFCFFRRDNALCPRYRKSEPEILEAACRLAASGVHLIDLTLGEDPLLYEVEGFEGLCHLVRALKAATNLPLMVSPGAVPGAALLALARSGASWYACYQETHRPSLFKRLRPGQSYRERLEKKVLARGAGLLIEEGILCGVGESARDVVESVRAMDALQADQVRVMTFVPAEGIPLAYRGDPEREMLAIAALRLCFPDRLIPASLDVDGLAGLKRRLRAGANVVTSLVPAGMGLCGVAHSRLDIEEGKRSFTSVLRILDQEGLFPSSLEDYRGWMEERRRGLAVGGIRHTAGMGTGETAAMGTGETAGGGTCA